MVTLLAINEISLFSVPELVMRNWIVVLLETKIGSIHALKHFVYLSLP